MPANCHPHAHHREERTHRGTKRREDHGSPSRQRKLIVGGPHPERSDSSNNRRKKYKEQHEESTNREKDAAEDCDLDPLAKREDPRSVNEWVRTIARNCLRGGLDLIHGADTLQTRQPVPPATVRGRGR